MRPLMGACSSLVTAILFYPLDVQKAYAHLNVARPITYKGVVWDACGSFAATYVYFETYERLLVSHGVAPAATIAIGVSSFIASPVGTIVRRRQLGKSQCLTLRTHANVYMLAVVRNVPRAVVKYTVYEFVCSLCGARVSNALRGLMGGLCAGIVSTILFAPMDYWKTCLSVQASPQWNQVFSGCKNALLYSTLSNAFGHALLELLSPRVPRHSIRTIA